MSFEPDIFYDYTLINFAEFLRENLNKRGVVSMSKYPDRFPDGYPDVVNNVFFADHPNISIIEMPVLKVYRMNDESYRYKGGNGVRTSNIVIEYSLGYPTLTQLPNLLNWVSFHTHQLFLDYEIAEFPTGKAVQNDLRFISDRTEYRTGISFQTQEEYPFIRLIVRLRDDACPKPRDLEQFNFDNCC